MSNVEVSITGLKELEAELARLPDKIGKRCLRRAMRDGANVFLMELRRWVQTARFNLARRHPTGRLLASLAIETKFRQFTFSAWVGSLKASGRHHVLRFLEFGTGKHISQRSGKLSRRSVRFAASGRGIQPRHWMERSFESMKGRALALVQDRLTAYLAKYRPGA
jgi:hypothetical protein